MQVDTLQLKRLHALHDNYCKTRGEEEQGEAGVEDKRESERNKYPVRTASFYIEFAFAQIDCIYFRCSVCNCSQYEKGVRAKSLWFCCNMRSPVWMESGGDFSLLSLTFSFFFFNCGAKNVNDMTFLATKMYGLLFF